MTTAATELLTAGVDVGSSSVKVAVVADRDDGAPRVLARLVERIRRRDARQVATGLFEQALGQAGVGRGDLAYVASTGDGEALPFRTGHFYSMTAHARGGLFLEPAATAVMDMGALHARAILMDGRAKVLGYRMTSQCASGSGQFLENIGRYLGVTLEEIGPLSKQSCRPEACSSICAVLAETDVINMVSRSIGVPDILKGIHQSMAGRYHKLLVSAGARGVVLLTGGLARDVGLHAALRELAEGHEPRLDVRSHEDSILAGALGAALWGAFRHRKLEARAAEPGAGAR